MKKSVYISVLCVVLLLGCIFCSTALEQGALAAIKSAEKKVAATADESTSDKAELSVVQAEPIVLSEGNAVVIGLSKSDELQLTKWTSENPKIVSVDSGGRIDGIKVGTAVVTALFTDNREMTYEVTVTEAEPQKEVDIYTTAITANEDIMLENICDESRLPFEIRVNRKQNCVTVYTYDSKGKYTVPVRAMICSCGKNNGTITGEFNLYFEHEWHPLYDNVYGYYVTGISGDFLFHSVPYYTPSPNELETEEYNKLGTSASLGCVRLAAADSKWIYDHCALGTKIVIYDSDEAEPLGRPEAIKITDLKCGWDPTDNNPKNPYNKKKPEIKGVSDITITVGESFSPLGKVKGYDTCGNDITDKIKYIGNVVTTRAGKYKVSYSLTDVLGRSCEKSAWVTVEQNKAINKIKAEQP